MINPTILLTAKQMLEETITDFILNDLDEVKNVPVNHSSLVLILGNRIRDKKIAEKILNLLANGKYSQMLDWIINLDLNKAEKKIQNWIKKMI